MSRLSDAILDFWFGPTWASTGPLPPARLDLWFGGRAETDRRMRDEFGEHLTLAARGDYDDWSAHARTSLALILLLDQFSRNIYRNSPAAFATDAKALRTCHAGLASRFDQQLPAVARAFYYLPLEHSEDLADQERSVALFTRLYDEAPTARGESFASFLDYAVRHRDIIARFGRFPHRNRILGRTSTSAEEAFLELPGSSF